MISNRMATIPPSPIRKLVPLSDAAKKRGIKVYHVNIGQPDIETPQEAMKAVHTFSAPVLEYSPSNGIVELRESMKNYFNSLKYDITEKDIIITNGGSEAIYFAFMVTMDVGDEVLVPEPYYANYNGFAKMAGVVIKPVLTVVDNAFRLPSEEEMENYITPGKTKAIILCTPNNPTGTVREKSELEQIVRFAKKHNLAIIADEVYNEFVYDGKQHISMMHFPEVAENVILIDSVSKRYSACGARIGAFISKNEQFVKASMVLAQARLCPPTIDQMLAVELFKTDRAYLDAVRAEYCKRRDVVFEELNKIPGVVATQASGAFYTVVKLPIKSADDFAKWLLESFEDNKETVMVSPAGGFYGTPGKGENEIRIAYVLNEKDMRRSIELLRKALEKYQPEAREERYNPII